MLRPPPGLPGRPTAVGLVIAAAVGPASEFFLAAAAAGCCCRSLGLEESTAFATAGAGPGAAADKGERPLRSSALLEKCRSPGLGRRRALGPAWPPPSSLDELGGSVLLEDELREAAALATLPSLPTGLSLGPGGPGTSLPLATASPAGRVVAPPPPPPLPPCDVPGVPVETDDLCHGVRGLGEDLTRPPLLSPAANVDADTTGAGGSVASGTATAAAVVGLVVGADDAGLVAVCAGLLASELETPSGLVERRQGKRGCIFTGCLDVLYL